MVEAGHESLLVFGHTVVHEHLGFCGVGLRDHCAEPLCVCVCVCVCVASWALPIQNQVSFTTCFSHWASGKISLKEGVVFLAQNCLKTADSDDI